MPLSSDLRHRAGLLLWVALLFLASYKALDAGSQRAPDSSREQRVATAYAALQAAEGRGTLVLLGDSITAGRPWQATPGCPRLLNLGVSGATTADLLHNLALAQKAGAERALLMIGINDLRHDVPLRQLLANYREILRQLQAAGIEPTVQSTLHVTPLHVQQALINRQVDELNRQLLEWTRQHGWRYVDVQAVIAPRGYRGDGLHLNAEGYGAWQRLIDPLLCPASDQPGQAQQPPGQDQHLHEQAAEA